MLMTSLFLLVFKYQIRISCYWMSCNYDTRAKIYALRLLLFLAFFSRNFCLNPFDLLDFINYFFMSIWLFHLSKCQCFKMDTYCSGFHPLFPWAILIYNSDRIFISLAKTHLLQKSGKFLPFFQELFLVFSQVKHYVRLKFWRSEMIFLINWDQRHVLFRGILGYLSGQ